MSKRAALKLDAFLPYRLSIASNAVSRLIANAYQRRFGLSIPEWRLIAVLHEDGPSTQAQLVARTLMDKVAVSRAARALEARGLLDRPEDDKDARARRVSLTRAGESLHAEIAPAAKAYERALLAGFAPAETERLTDMLRRLESAAAALENKDFTE